MAAESITCAATDPHESDDSSIVSDSSSVAGPADDVGALEKQTTVASAVSTFENRAHAVISRIRSREPGQTAKFTHPLAHTKTGPDVIVDFDGPDDPYRPLNWGFKKKAVTTILYGLTTMGMLFPFFSLRVCERH